MNIRGRPRMTRPAPGTRWGRSRRSHAHDQLQGVTLVGRVRTDLFRNDIGAIERHEIVGPRIDAFYTEHLYCGEDDLFGSGHPPETVVALALAYHAFKTGRWPSDETPARAPAGGTR